MADLKTNYKDRLLDTSVNTERKFNLVDSNENIIASGVSLRDITKYSQEGDTFGAADINKITATINEQNNNLANGQVKFSVESDGAYVTYNVGADTVTKKLGSCEITDIYTQSVSTGTTDTLMDLKTSYTGEEYDISANTITVKRKCTLHISSLVFYNAGNSLQYTCAIKKNGITIADKTVSAKKDDVYCVSVDADIECDANDIITLTTKSSVTLSGLATAKITIVAN